LIAPRDGGPPTLAVEDNGIGLTEQEVRQGLATLGGACRATAGEPGDGAHPEDGDLLSRFGLGVLTCLAVADEVRLLTRSLDRGSPTLEWVCRADGTYTLRHLDCHAQGGTQVYLRPRAECRRLFQPSLLQEAAAKYGEFLPCPLVFQGEGERKPLNRPAPWSIDRTDAGVWRKRQLGAARRLFGKQFLDAVPIRSGVGGVEGAALIPAEPPGLLHRPEQRVYRHGILLADHSRLLPDWACWLGCIANVRYLRTTPLADGLRDDDRLSVARRALGRSLHGQLAELAETQPQRWRQIIGVHGPAMKALAAEDDDFFRLFIELLPFESSIGRTWLASLSRRHLSLYYLRQQRTHPQLLELAADLGMGIVFARDDLDAQLLEKASRRSAAAPLRELKVGELAGHLNDVTDGDRRERTCFLDLADEVLAPLRCAAELKRFGTPRVLAILLDPSATVPSHDGLPAAKADPANPNYQQLWLNLDHPLVGEVSLWPSRHAVAKAVKLIYAHAKLLSTGEVDQTGAKLLFEGLRSSLEE
jgi:molecular chaperone HtpG